jgi:hypothetical protein
MVIVFEEYRQNRIYTIPNFVLKLFIVLVLFTNVFKFNSCYFTLHFRMTVFSWMYVSYNI